MHAVLQYIQIQDAISYIDVLKYIAACVPRDNLWEGLGKDPSAGFKDRALCTDTWPVRLQLLWQVTASSKEFSICIII